LLGLNLLTVHFSNEWCHEFFGAENTDSGTGI